MPSCGFDQSNKLSDTQNEQSYLIVTKINKSIFKVLTLENLTHQEGLDKAQGENTLRGSLKAETQLSLNFANSLQNGKVLLQGKVEANSTYQVISSAYGTAIDGNTKTKGDFSFPLQLTENGFEEVTLDTKNIKSDSTYTSPLNFLYAPFAKQKFKDGLPTLHQAFNKGIGEAIEANTQKLIPEIIGSLNHIYKIYFYLPFVAKKKDHKPVISSTESEINLSVVDKSGRGGVTTHIKPLPSSDLQIHFHENMLTHLLNEKLRNFKVGADVLSVEPANPLANMINSQFNTHTTVRGSFDTIDAAEVWCDHQQVKFRFKLKLVDENENHADATLLVTYGLTSSEMGNHFKKMDFDIVNVNPLTSAMDWYLRDLSKSFFNDEFLVSAEATPFNVSTSNVQIKDLNSKAQKEWLSISINFKKAQKK